MSINENTTHRCSWFQIEDEVSSELSRILAMSDLLSAASRDRDGLPDIADATISRTADAIYWSARQVEKLLEKLNTVQADERPSSVQISDGTISEGDEIHARLIVDIHGLGQEGDVVVADKGQLPSDGDWMLVAHDAGTSCVRWEPGLPRGAKVIQVKRAAP